MTNPIVARLQDSFTSERLLSLQLMHLVEGLSAFDSLQAWQDSQIHYLLACGAQGVQLIPRNKKLQALAVDFTAGAVGFRGQQNVRNEMLVKAVLGRDKQHIPSVIDATAGLGRDSFLLAVLGCQVTMLERNPIVATLLADGLARFKEHEGNDIAYRMDLTLGNSIETLAQVPTAEVVYLDPMFPKREKSALVKKEMQIFKDIVGPDADSDGLLGLAKQAATKRVVVKRPSKAPHLADEKPTYSLTGRSSRFDIYQC